MDLSNPSSHSPSALGTEEDQRGSSNCSPPNSPNWTRQPWFPDLIQMLVDCPLLLPKRQSLLFIPFQPTAYHPLWKSLHLTVWPLSGTVTKQQAFQRKLLTSCWPHGDWPPRSPGGHGYAGVLNGAPVPFQLL